MQWFAGYTPYYTCVVWGGYDDYSRLESSRYPKILWNHIMKQLHEGLAYKEFEMPEDVEVSSVCKTSGKIAIAGVCPRQRQSILQKVQNLRKNAICIRRQ